MKRVISKYAEYSVENPGKVSGMWGVGLLAAAVIAFAKMSTISAANMELLRNLALLCGICAVVLLALWRNITATASTVAIMAVLLCYVGVASAVMPGALSFSALGLLSLTGIALSYAAFINYGYISEVERILDNKNWIWDKQALISDGCQKSRLPVIMASIAAVISFGSGAFFAVREGALLAVGAALLGFAALTLVPALLVVLPPASLDSYSKETNSLKLVNMLSTAANNRPWVMLVVGLLILAMPLYTTFTMNDYRLLSSSPALMRYIVVALVLTIVVFAGLYKTPKLPLLGLVLSALLFSLGYAVLGPATEGMAQLPMMALLAFALSHMAYFFSNWFLYAKKYAQPSSQAVEQTWRETGRALMLSVAALMISCLITKFAADPFQPASTMLVFILTSVSVCDLFITPALLGRLSFQLGIPTEKELEVLKGDLQVAHMREGQHEYTDDELTRMPAYDLFTWAGKTVVRPAGNNGTRRLFHLLSPKPGQKVLEIGCGQGVSSITLAKRTGAHVTGIDLNDFMIGQAKRNAADMGVTNCEFEVGDATKLPYPDNTFDIVYTEAVSMFITPAAIYNEAFRVLKPGGVVAGDEFTWTKRPTPDMEKLTCVLACGVPGYFMYFYTLPEWHKHIERSGFQMGPSREYLFAYFTMKAMVDEEGLLGAMKIFWYMMTRPAALKRLVSIMYFFQKYEGWFSYVIFTATKPTAPIERKEIKEVEVEVEPASFKQGKSLV